MILKILIKTQHMHKIEKKKKSVPSSINIEAGTSAIYSPTYSD